MLQCHFMVQPGAILWFKAQAQLDSDHSLIESPFEGD